MGNHTLEASEMERNNCGQVNCNVKPWSQRAKAVRTANAVLVHISRAFHYRDRLTFLRLYTNKLYVQPCLELWCQLEPMVNGRLKMPWKGAKNGSGSRAGSDGIIIILVSREGIHERNIESGFLGKDSSLLRLECLSGFLPSFFPSTKCYSWMNSSRLESFRFADFFC